MVLQRERLDHLVESNDEHRDMLARLEQVYDDTGDEVVVVGDELELRSGDELAAEVERYLRDN